MTKSGYCQAVILVAATLAPAACGAVLNDNATRDVDALKARLHEQFATLNAAFNDAAEGADRGTSLRGSVRHSRLWRQRGFGL